jgi:hypothetical protein
MNDDFITVNVLIADYLRRISSDDPTNLQICELHLQTMSLITSTPVEIIRDKLVIEKRKMDMRANAHLN